MKLLNALMKRFILAYSTVVQYSP